MSAVQHLETKRHIKGKIPQPKECKNLSLLISVYHKPASNTVLMGEKKMEHDFQKNLRNKKVFDQCVLDPSFQTLATPTKIIRLRGKLFSVLCCLVENNNQLVTREKLINDCWYGNIYTGQKAVTHTICHLRRLLKEQQINASITTLSKQGYVFTDHSKVQPQSIEQKNYASA